VADKYLYNNAGTITEKAAIQSSAGAGDAGKIPALDAGGHLDTSMMPSGIGADLQVIQASEALAAGDLVNVWSSSGAFRVRKADATSSGKEAHGFVRAAVSSGANATVYPPSSTNDQVSGLSPGTQYLSTTPGAATATPPSGSGNVVQRVGFAGSATALNFQPSLPIVLA
jgi:hypothetical protein